MNQGVIRYAVVTLVVLLLAISALAYIFVPNQMLGVVGIEATPGEIFLARALAAALLALIPGAWAARKQTNSPLEAPILLGLAGYMWLSSVVDLQAYLNAVVNFASVPSIVFRILLGLTLIWLTPRWSSRK